MLMRSLIILLTAAFFGATAVAGIVPHLLYGKRIAGEVVDAETGTPISHAHLAFTWVSLVKPSLFTGHASRDVCYHAASAITDYRGRFEIPPWQSWSTYDVSLTEPTVTIYASSYVPRLIVLTEGVVTPPVERISERYQLTPFRGTGPERLKSLFWGLANHDCPYGGESQKSLYPMMSAIHREARTLARTDDDNRTVRAIARIAAGAALAQNPLSTWDDQKIADFIQEHLQ